MKAVTSLTDLIGNTPLFKASNFENETGALASIYAKLEFFNPAGSVKDRVAKTMIEDAEKSGKLQKGATIVEPTSGNTGIALASIATAKGYKAVIVMPESMSMERKMLMKAYGAQLVLTDGKKGMQGAIEKAEELCKQHDDYVLMGQFVNPSNPKAHFISTGPEIWRDTEGQVDIFVAGVGTGGTLSGTGAYLKSKNPQIQVVAVEPLSSPVLSQNKSGSHKIQGIGAGFVPKTLDTDVYDEIIAVSDEDAFACSRAFSSSEGILVGISAGSALYAAAEIAKRAENKGKNVVVLLPDSGDRYLSTQLYAD